LAKYEDGPAHEAKFHTPCGLACHLDSLYLVDMHGGIRKIFNGMQDTEN
jgi:hypothetical protein